MLVLYGCGRSRWVRPLWTLRERVTTRDPFPRFLYDEESAVAR